MATLTDEEWQAAVKSLARDMRYHFEWVVESIDDHEAGRLKEAMQKGEPFAVDEYLAGMRRGMAKELDLIDQMARDGIDPGGHGCLFCTDTATRRPQREAIDAEEAERRRQHGYAG